MQLPSSDLIKSSTSGTYKTPSGTVSINGNTAVIPAIEIVPGDIVEVKTGEMIPADLRYG
jgi:magnesium-transporting ATPase (P-type)